MRSAGELLCRQVAVTEAVRCAHAFGEGNLKAYHAHVFNLTDMRDHSQWPEVRLVANEALVALQALYDASEREAKPSRLLDSDPDDGAPPWHCGDSEIKGDDAPEGEDEKGGD